MEKKDFVIYHSLVFNTPIRCTEVYFSDSPYIAGTKTGNKTWGIGRNQICLLFDVNPTDIFILCEKLSKYSERK